MTRHAYRRRGDPAPHKPLLLLVILELAERIGDNALAARSCARLALATFLHDGSLSHDLINRALAGPEQPAGLSIDLRPKLAVAQILHLTGDLDGARVLFQQEYAEATAQGGRGGLVRCA